MAFFEWLDARDGEALARAWHALGAMRCGVGAPNWKITAHGAAQLAAAFLGWPVERVAWLGVPESGMPAPIFKTERTTSRCFLEYGADLVEDCYEYWTIREQREGERGVQHVQVVYRQDDGTREGTGCGGTVVRVFDRATRTGASIFLDTRIVATIGKLDLSALELFAHYRAFDIPTWHQYDLEATRGLVAQLAAEIDAHYDVSATWPGGLTNTYVTSDDHVASPSTHYYERRFESGSRAVTIRESRFRREGVAEDGWATVMIEGLPWGHELRLLISDSDSRTHGHVQLRLPIALGETVIARLAGVPGVRLSG